MPWARPPHSPEVKVARLISQRRWWLLLLAGLILLLWYSAFTEQLSLANLKTHQLAFNG